MQYLQLVISVFLVTVGVFRVDGSPTAEYRYNKLLEEQKFYAQITMESLAEALNFKDGVDIAETIAHTLVALSRSTQDGGIFYRMPIVVLTDLEEKNIATNFIKAWAALCDIMDDARESRALNQEVNIEELIESTLRRFYKLGVNYQISETFYELSESISNAMKGDLEEAKKIVAELAELYKKDFQKLKSMKKYAKLAVLEEATDRLHHWSDKGLIPLIEIAKAKI